jgi:hypothetical protein
MVEYRDVVVMQVLKVYTYSAKNKLAVETHSHTGSRGEQYLSSMVDVDCGTRFNYGSLVI